MIGRLVFALAAFAAAVGFVRADDHETLKVLRECPVKGWHRACLPIAFLFSDDKSGRLRMKKEDDGSLYPPDMLDYIVVEGALLETRGRGIFRLELDYPLSETGSPNELGGFAFVGRSRAGRPIVLTDRGPLEIVTPGIDFESPVDLYVVREKRGRVIRRLIGGYGMPFIATKAGEIGVWDAKREICVTAPERDTRELAIITTACKAAGVPEQGIIVGGNAAVDMTVSDESASHMIGAEPVSMKVFDAPGTGLLLIWANWEYCC